jgi:hypothetical protein
VIHIAQWGCGIFKIFNFLVDMGSFNIQKTTKNKFLTFQKELSKKFDF